MNYKNSIREERKAIQEHLAYAMNGILYITEFCNTNHIKEYITIMRSIRQLKLDLKEIPIIDEDNK